jgi:hypothetical protein
VTNEPALAFRRATREDLPDIVRMLADDPLGAIGVLQLTFIPSTASVLKLSLAR